MKFLTNTFFLYFQIAALVAAIWYWKRYKHSTQRHFLWFLMYVVCHEIVGLSYKYFFKMSNDIFYNLYTIISFLFYFLWFYKILQKRKWFVHIILTTFSILFLYDLFDKNPFHELYLNPIIVGSFGVLILTISYFVELLNTDSIVSFARSQTFWIVTGLFSFYIGLLPLLLFHAYLKYGSDFYTIVITVLNVVLYGCYLKSFLCLKQKT
ncbi:hypothetical protein [Kordia jejudonensis]|uniref:hypothetical protein n=1 Tax=Kordia jejudonensis TaxID=1348245 RepID=UPI0006290364|nr:hypothetical protein [Kordia jejudonensis]